MVDGDGNGWVTCRCGHRHWGRHGAAGLLLLRPLSPAPHVLLQLRAGWTHEGGTWGLPGGARDSHEDVTAAALREAGEEAGVGAEDVRVVAARVGVDHGDWRYTYVVALEVRETDVRPLTAESDELRWVAVHDVPDLPLHRALADAWPGLAPEIARALDGAAG